MTKFVTNENLKQVLNFLKTSNGDSIKVFTPKPEICLFKIGKFIICFIRFKIKDIKTMIYQGKESFNISAKINEFNLKETFEYIEKTKTKNETFATMPKGFILSVNYNALIPDADKDILNTRIFLFEEV